MSNPSEDLPFNPRSLTRVREKVEASLGNDYERNSQPFARDFASLGIWVVTEADPLLHN